jgi:hypothetical protein
MFYCNNGKLFGKIIKGLSDGTKWRAPPEKIKTGYRTSPRSMPSCFDSFVSQVVGPPRVSFNVKALYIFSFRGAHLLYGLPVGPATKECPEVG